MIPAARIRPVGDDRILIEVAGWRILASATCPHRKGRLRFGRVNPRTLRITCPLHHATFDLLTGRRIGGPTCGPLRVAVLDEPASAARP
ncbi:MAG: Rieske (2Fe-2S) protein [Pseudonocardiaceae bacterium]